MTTSRDHCAGIIRPCPWRSQTICRRVFVESAVTNLGGRKQLPALVEIIFLYNLIGGIGVVPCSDQFAASPVLVPRPHAAYDLLHPAAVPVVKVLARSPTRHLGPDDPVLGVELIAIPVFG